MILPLLLLCLQPLLPVIEHSAMKQARVLVEPVKMHSDARGAVFEPLNVDELRAQGNTHVVLSNPGAIRGNHYHRVGVEVTVVVGPALVRYRDVIGGGDIHEVQVPPGGAQRFSFSSGVAHAFSNPGPGVMLLASFNTEVHDPSAPDVVREVLI
jgi:UDP-2-acetamido-2,6-beta-L-arabino-hexul-4-ose reductase